MKIYNKYLEYKECDSISRKKELEIEISEMIKPYITRLVDVYENLTNRMSDFLKPNSTGIVHSLFPNTVVSSFGKILSNNIFNCCIYYSRYSTEKSFEVIFIMNGFEINTKYFTIFVGEGSLKMIEYINYEKIEKEYYESIKKEWQDIVKNHIFYLESCLENTRKLEESLNSF